MWSAHSTIWTGISSSCERFISFMDHTHSSLQPAMCHRSNFSFHTACCTAPFRDSDFCISPFENQTISPLSKQSKCFPLLEYTELSIPSKGIRIDSSRLPLPESYVILPPPLDQTWSLSSSNVISTVTSACGSFSSSFQPGSAVLQCSPASIPIE